MRNYLVHLFCNDVSGGHFSTVCTGPLEVTRETLSNWEEKVNEVFRESGSCERAIILSFSPMDITG